MKASEILRGLADVLSSLEADQSQPETIVRTDPDAQEYEPEDSSETEVFLPPLQAKLELLKKATGVENIYDEEQYEEEEQHSYDELATIKKNAGLSVPVLDALSDDEPLDV